MKFLRLLLWSSLLLAAPALAQQSGLTFARADIQIHPATPAPAKDGEMVMVRPSLTYNVEVRSQDALRLEYIHTLNTLTDNTGVMITFNHPSNVSLPYMQVPTPVDALFVGSDGTVLQIVPNAILSNISAPISATEPVKAFLFLKAGQATARFIKPRDTITGNMFTPAPSLQQ
jgi:uncharacterized membrane protein (UPF0127 family)